MEFPSFSRQLKKNRLLGSWCSFASFSSVETMTELGFDFLIMDMQHCEITAAQFPSLLGAFRNPKPIPIVRVPENNYHIINWLLDQGVPGILVPMVNSVEDAHQAVKAARFPPLGKRSFGPQRAARYSFAVQEYMENVEERSTLIVQVEDVLAAQNIEKILEVPGIDGVFMGPNDLAFSMLKPGQNILHRGGVSSSASGQGAQHWTAFARRPEVSALCADVMEKCRSMNVPFGTTTAVLEEARSWLKRGASFVTVGNDFLFMRAGAKQLCNMP